jgi:Bacteriophage abortive infection AbiH
MDPWIGSSARKIIVLGNGFDLNLGLKTSYADFFKSRGFDNLVDDGNSIAIQLRKAQQLSNWVDVETELACISRLTADSVRVDKFRAQFNELTIELLNYLELVSSNPVPQNTAAYQLLRSCYGSVDDLENTVIFNFNYTNTVVKILTEIGWREDQIASIHHQIHGSIVQKRIVFGVEDDADIHIDAANGGHIFLRKAVSPIATKIPISDWLNKANEIHIFGHSLGTTDNMHFDHFFGESLGGDSEISIHHYGEQGLNLLWGQLDRLSRKRLSILRRKITTIDVSMPLRNL